MLDNLTPEDLAALARVQAASPDQIEHFKKTVRLLIDGYGQNAPRHIVIMSIDREADRFEMDGINTNEAMVRAMLVMGSEVLNSSANQQEALSTLQ